MADYSIKYSAKTILSFWILLICTSTSVLSQENSDNKYSRPLKQVLYDVEQQFGVTIKYVDSLVIGKVVTYAAWKFRTDVDKTLDNILKPLELKVKKEGAQKYKLSVYEYYRWDVADGWANLDSIAAKYNNLKEWELRKQALKLALLKALQLNVFPATPKSVPVKTTPQTFDGYTVENIAIEYLPGVWVSGSLYKPLRYKNKIPVVLHPQGHWEKHRYRPDCQYTSANIAKMGCMVFNYDMFAWGESALQVAFEDHRKSLAMSLQLVATTRILDYLLTLKEADTNRVAITGGSGAGTHTILFTAIDERIKVSAPIVSLSSYFFGGCPCESGMPIHQCSGKTNNVEIAAMAAPKPQLIVSDGGDWTDKMPEHDFPYLQKMYSYYNQSDNVVNVHLPNDKHDFGVNKRIALYKFLAKEFKLDITPTLNIEGVLDDTNIVLLPEQKLYVFGEHGENLPANALKGFDNIQKAFYDAIKKSEINPKSQ